LKFKPLTKLLRPIDHTLTKYAFENQLALQNKNKQKQTKISHTDFLNAK
jgi:hypothetical protein